MREKVVGRASELEAIGRLLDSLDEGPAALVLEGDPGIGRTTLLLAAAELARQRGMQVYSCTGSPSAARRAGTGDPERQPIPLRDPDRVEVRPVGALAEEELGQVLRHRAPVQLQRHAIARIGEASGGNPFYALELSRVLPADAAPAAA